MNILFIINSLQEKAGSERVACQLANLFNSELGHTITLVNRFASKQQCAFDIDQEINYLLIKGNYIAFYKEIQKIIDNHNYDMVIVHNMGKISLLCSLLKTKKTKLVSLEHVSFSSRPRWVRYLSRILYNRINTIVTLTERDKKEYTEWHRHVVKINNISPYSFQEKVDFSSKKIIAIGRLTFQKNFQALLQSWKEIYSKLPEWHLEIYGKGEDEEMLKSYIIENKLKRVSLQGICSNMQDVYKNASFLVMSSRYEGLPMVLIEAQSFGLPIISFDCPFGPREIIEHNQTGILVEDQNISSLSKEILHLATHQQLLREYSKNTKTATTRYTKSNVLAEWKKLFYRMNNLYYDKLKGIN